MSKNNKNKSLFENVWVIRLVSLLISLLLFGYVFSENYGITTINRNDAISTTRNETISNLPVQINMDTERYFISGLPETVVLSLTGPESVIAQTLSANDFDIVTEDLDLLGPGRHTIQIRAENLSDELNYQLTPSRVNVDIEEKVTIESAVEVLFDTSALSEEYIAGEPILSNETVMIIGPASTIERIERIYVRVPTEGSLTDNIVLDTVVQVEDANRNKLNVTVDPQQVEVEVPINPYEKSVPIEIKQAGTPVSGREYTLTIIGESDVILRGSRTLLADVDEVIAEVNVSNVRSSTVVTVPIDLPYPTVQATPTTVEINIKVDVTQAESLLNRSGNNENLRTNSNNDIENENDR